MSVAQIYGSDSKAMKDTHKSKSNQSPARREPTQARARRTRQLIFETALRILDQEGEPALTTNRIAELSGFSIGTVYQYFANKHEILANLIAEERRVRLARIAAELQGLSQDERTTVQLAERVRAILRIVLGAFGGRHKARRALLERALRNSAGRLMNEPAAEIARMLRALSYGSENQTPLTEIEALVLAEAVSGTVRAALLSNPSLLKSAAFEQALFDLTVGFLRQRRTAA